MTKLIKKSHGFTLIELLVVIAIIGILAAVVLVSLTSARGKARDARRIAEVRQLQSALELYNNDNNTYPSTLASLSSTYVTNAPVMATGGTCLGNYVYSGSAGGYSLAFCTEYATNFGAAGTRTATQNGIQ